MINVVLLAAGYATRLYPLTKDRPKPLLPIAGRPILDHTLEKLKPLKNLGTVYTITNHRFAEHFEQWASERPAFDIQVIDDETSSNETRLGAIGDMKFLLDKKGVGGDWLVLGGDNLFDFSLTHFVDFAEAKKPAVSIGVYDCKDLEAAKQFGLVATDPDGRIQEFQEKPAEPKSTLIAMCLYFFPQSTLAGIQEYIQSGETQDAPGNYIRWRSEKESVYAYVFEQSWYDIGNLDAYEKANADFSSRKNGARHWGDTL
jgi:glucose-1-phosphate thymidylyltransferase